MVMGLERFRDCFRDYADRYALIGGSACYLLLEEAGLDFRATKDLDIVLCVEVLDTSFVKAFWTFVREAGYQAQQTTGGEKRYYRFHHPINAGYPAMLELFSRKPDTLVLDDSAHLTPIPMDDDISSLSAILLDDAYYTFLRLGVRRLDDLSIIDATHLIPLKARAWLDLTHRKSEGAQIDGKDIAKHKNDVFRLYRVLDPTITPDIPREIRRDMEVFLKAMSVESLDLKSLGIARENQSSVLEGLRRLYIPA